MSEMKSFGIRKDVIFMWDNLMEADFSFVKAGSRSGGSGVDLYLLSMVIGLRMNEEIPLRGLETKFTYTQIADNINLESLCLMYGLEPANHVDILGRISGNGIEYIYNHHFIKEERMLDLQDILQTWSLTSEIKKCIHCNKYSPSDTATCRCGSDEFEKR